LPAAFGFRQPHMLAVMRLRVAKDMSLEVHKIKEIHPGVFWMLLDFPTLDSCLLFSAMNPDKLLRKALSSPTNLRFEEIWAQARALEFLYLE
jgi:hypothetical protein